MDTDSLDDSLHDLLIEESLAVLVPTVVNPSCYDWCQWSHFDLLVKLVGVKALYGLRLVDIAPALLLWSAHGSCATAVVNAASKSTSRPSVSTPSVTYSVSSATHFAINLTKPSSSYSSPLAEKMRVAC